MAIYMYPAPIRPEVKKPKSVEDCLPVAKTLVKHQTGRAALGPVKKGDNTLIVTWADQDEYVKEAVSQALKEEGAEKVDFIFVHDLTGEEPKATSVEDGWLEPYDRWRFPGGRRAAEPLYVGLRKHLTQHPEYTAVFCGIGGRGHVAVRLGEHGYKFRNNWILNNWEEFISDNWTYPEEIRLEIERRTIEPLKRASAVRITDPEGTHLEFTLSAEEAYRWQKGAWFPGHLKMDTLMATYADPRAGKYSPEVLPVFADISGVLAGTANHFGFYPRIEVYFEHGRLAEVKGGGRYGDLITELKEEYKDVHWPFYPDKGFFWYCDCALCTFPKAFRRLSDRFNSYWYGANFSERNRTGIFHVGFGSRQHGKEYLKYVEEHNLPTGHIHVHNYFVTFEIRLRDTGHWLKLVDKGWLTAMEEPEVRALAVKYGDPDKLLSYDWIPPLPGINCPGDYLRDYAPDPMKWQKSYYGEK